MNIKTESGIIRKVKKDEVGVSIEYPAKCDKCRIKDNCYGDSGQLLWIKTKGTFNIGQKVRISIKGSAVLIASAWLYGIPLVTILLSIIISYMFFFSSLIEEKRVLFSAITGLIFLLITGLIFKLADKKNFLSPKTEIYPIKETLRNNNIYYSNTNLS